MCSFAEDIVYLIWFDADRQQDVAALRGVLDAEERARASRLAAGRPRERFIVARALTRLALANALGIDAASVRLAVGPRGKPRLASSRANLRFSLSHTGGRGVLALARGREVGVDLERERRIDTFLLARRCFSPQELADFEALPPRERGSALFRCFTRKESFVKALGSGLSFALSGVDVGIGAAPARQVWRGEDGGPAAWTTVSLDAGDGYAAALTVEGRGWRVETLGQSGGAEGGSVPRRSKAGQPEGRE
jgi:4'-phosphopantetheinyl transferase